MSETWKEWVGQFVDGKFLLRQYLGGSERGAVFLTERRQDGQPLEAAIKLIPSVPESDESQLSLWQQASELLHPNLLPLYEAGRCEIGDVPVLYVLMQRAEESLSEVVPGRALDASEVRALLEPALEALAYLHGNGFVHGHLKPANILAIGDQIKLSSDALRRAGDESDAPGRPDAYDPPERARGVIPVSEGISAAADVWALGVMLVEAFTQSLPDSTQLSGEPPLPDLPEPFADIARHCLLRNPKNRWTLGQIAARLRNQPVIAQAPAPAREVHTPARTAQRAVDGPRPGATGRRLAVAIAVVAVLALALAVPRLLRRRSETPQVPDVASERPSSQPAAEPADARRATSPRTPATSPRQAAVPKTQDSAGGTAVPASAKPKTEPDDAPRAEAKLPAGTVVSGAVVQQILPEALEGARNTLRGTLRVSVKVDVDPAGNVEGAEITSPEASKYFARVALQAAQRWKFQPPQVTGRNVPSSWTLRFYFTRDETTATSTQETP